MGNPNRRTVPSKPAPATKPTEQVAPLPLPAPEVLQCTRECGVLNRHTQESTWHISDEDLPYIVKVKQAALNTALKDRDFSEARKMRHWLDRFYYYHGPFDGSALDDLPNIPDPPKPCKNAACPVQNYHVAKTYIPGSDECPSIVQIKTHSLTHAIFHGEHGRAVADQQFLKMFWNVHGG
ncbi:MAG: hypothetical protein Q9221_005793 [Calogaya cf. arnoldii]